MENKIKIGETVITRKFEGTSNCKWLRDMTDYINKEGVVSGISGSGNYEVHGWFWPPSAVEPVTKQWEPKPGEMVEVRQYSGDKWLQAKFIGMDGNRFVCWGNGYSDWKYCQQLPKPLREQISEILYESPKADTKALDRIMEVVEKVEGRKCNE